jgi:RNA polymerase sigma factor FliA
MYDIGCKNAEPDEREQTVEEFLPWIKHLAFKLSKGFQQEGDTDDLISAGILGLLEAMDRYDGSVGTKLHTYAFLRIRGAMLDELRKKDWFPRSARTKEKKRGGAIRRLQHKLGRYPTEEEVAQELNMDILNYLDMLRDLGNLSVQSIDEMSETSGIDQEGIVSFIMGDQGTPERCAETREMETILGMEIDRLPQKQRMVLGPYYYEDMSMGEIARTLGITQARISQIHSQAIRSLRMNIEERLNPGDLLL